ncbi:hypothetical protein EVAR_27144_1 [Eumeta japonica]|uniref:Uncharacterized protein n=1 Tax=Eumeta variegata TaxID=151549 RepID=A0A4C1VXI4_EUMVA|nr:hypothetical protein EVAR_27144_1 [Eumeta japonica]
MNTKQRRANFRIGRETHEPMSQERLTLGTAGCACAAACLRTYTTSRTLLQTKRKFEVFKSGRCARRGSKWVQGIGNTIGTVACLCTENVKSH